MKLRNPEGSVAIIGMGFRFPGKANDADSFWKNLYEGKDAITQIPEDRWNIEAYFNPAWEQPGKMYVRSGGFIDDIDKFDASFFGISPREAENMDPQQRLLLEVTWEAFEDAGLIPEDYIGSDTGVFIGQFMHDWEGIQTTDIKTINFNTAIGTSMTITSNRISYQYGFVGPSLSIDTACSSSSVSIHLACQSILNRECSMCVAGGVNLILRPELTTSICKANMLSPDGRCKSFDSSADGYVRSEGAGVVLLKRYFDALRDGNQILGIISGSGVNQDGRTNGGITVPNGYSQAALFQSVMSKAKVGPDQIQYIETHGTGTKLGDPTEVNALGEKLKKRKIEKNCIIGSVKSNIGHLESAAGVAGLIKVLLAFRYEKIPPNIHFNNPNPLIKFDQFPIEVADRLIEWPRDRENPRIASVNSFGFGGTNSNLIVQEHISEKRPSENRAVFSGGHFLFPLSARSREALIAMARLTKEFLEQKKEHYKTCMYDICYTFALHRSHHNHRLTIAAKNIEDLIDSLGAYCNGEKRQNLVYNQVIKNKEFKLSFVFSGNGPQWYAMGRELIRDEPIFKEVIDTCDNLLKDNADWSLLEELSREKDLSNILRTDITQPALFALQVGISRLLESWGIYPDMVVGHSVGEVAASYAAGVFSLKDAAHIIYHRGRLQYLTENQGKMLALDIPLKEAQKLIEPYKTKVSIAAINSESSITLSGDAQILQEIYDTLEEKDIFSRFLNVKVPYHSIYMEPILNDLEKSLKPIEPKHNKLPLYSTVTGKLRQYNKWGPPYWKKNVRDTVLFSKAIDNMIIDGSNIFVEIGPHPVLSGYIKQIIKNRDSKGKAIPTLIRPSLINKNTEIAAMLNTLGSLYTLGYPIDWKKFYPDKVDFIRFPFYPWQKERFWYESDEYKLIRMGQSVKYDLLGEEIHPLLGYRLKSARSIWNLELNLNNLGFLMDHKLKGEIVYPGAAYVEMAIAAAMSPQKETYCSIENIKFHELLYLNEENTTSLQLSIDEKSKYFEINSMQDKYNNTWVKHASGNISSQKVGVTDNSDKIEDIIKRCDNEIPKDKFYKYCFDMGLCYDERFQGVDKIKCGNKESVGTIRLPEQLVKDSESYYFHPVLLDSCFQIFIGSIFKEKEKTDMYFPIEIEQIKLFAKTGKLIWAHAKITDESHGKIKGDICLYSDNGKSIGKISGVKLQSLDYSLGLRKVDKWLYQTHWIAKELDKKELNKSKIDKNWLIFADKKGFGQRLANTLIECGYKPIIVFWGKQYQKFDSAKYVIDIDSYEDMRRLFNNINDLNSIVHCLSLDISEEKDINSEILDNTRTILSSSILHILRAIEELDFKSFTNLTFLTSQVHFIEETDKPLSFLQSPLWGLARVMRKEHPQYKIKLIDIGRDLPRQDTVALLKDISADSYESEAALRIDRRYVNRYIQSHNLPPAQSFRVVNPLDTPICLGISEPGKIDSLILNKAVLPPVGKHQVKIEVKYAGLNSNDYAKASNLISNTQEDYRDKEVSLGFECCGIVRAVGDNVENFKEGDRVVALAKNCIGSFVIADQRLVANKPEHLSFEEAASIPFAFLTAYYCLYYWGRIENKDRVLINNLPSAYGLAIVQIAKRYGATIFAVVDNKEKKEYLSKVGVDYVFDSNNSDFIEEILRLTDSKGVDIIINNMHGEFFQKSLELLDSFGRFIEIGKKDILENSSLELGKIKKGITFSNFDLENMLETRIENIKSVFKKVMYFFQDKELMPIPYKIFPISKVSEAFSFVEESAIKILIEMQAKEVKVSHFSGKRLQFIDKGSYLITGGLGGLGFQVAKWMAENGAKHIVLIGRSGASEEIERWADLMKKEGISVYIMKGDISKYEDVEKILVTIQKDMPELLGIIHAAGVLDDGILIHQNVERFKKVTLPKIEGAWNLHSLTKDIQLDFFVCFSSIASFFGWPGQGSYAFGNAFMDALAQYRRHKNLPCLSICWGPWSETGMASRLDENALKRMEEHGIDSIGLKDGLSILGELIQKDIACIGVGPVDWKRYFIKLTGDSHNLLFENLADFIDKEDSKDYELLERLSKARPNERNDLLTDYVQSLVASILGFGPDKEFDMDVGIFEIGLDSLTALAMRNRLKKELNISLSNTILFKYPTLSKLIMFLSESIESLIGEKAFREEKAEKVENTQDSERIKKDIDILSKEEIKVLLAKELDS